MTVDFDQDAADRTLRLIQLAHDKWHSGLATLRGQDITTPAWADLEGQQFIYAVCMLTLCRGLDDMCGDAKGTVPLTGYVAARPPVEMLLGAARYACNRTVHQLIRVGQPIGGITVPLQVPFRFSKFVEFRWVPEGHLPDPRAEDKGQLALREHYRSAFSGNEVTPTLDRLRQWFESQVP